MKLKDILIKAVNKNNKQVTLILKKRKADECRVSVERLLDMEIKADRDFLK